ncbi:sugar ABC transporter permease [Paenibacillus sp. IB182496]|uniref:Sugar ABC transporter permease n=2 Tax=Paenibacillus sabuli TaxID=2772509 RepID=A0A927BNX9_9BACL|nr:sugar ABC transporter permease [Paenibacillus sabuli]
MLQLLLRDKNLYFMLLPGLVYFIVFRYFPMAGLIIAFKDYDIFKGIQDSPWVGLDIFREVFSSSDFKDILFNTLLISFYKLIFGFPVPILLALLLNEIRFRFFQRLSQTILYLPHFISWVVIGGIMLTLLSPNYGIAGDIMRLFGVEPFNLLGSRDYFRSILVVSDIWRNAGWGTIIYLAALTQVDPTLYEAAVVDGANKWKQTWHITLPSIAPVIILLLILDIGRIMNVGFEQILILQNPLVRDISDVFETYVYRVGIQRGEYSFTAALDFFKSVVSAVLIISAHRISKRLGQEGLL